MLRDHLKINASDTLEKISNIHLQNQGQEEISEFVVKTPPACKLARFPFTIVSAPAALTPPATASLKPI